MQYSHVTMLNGQDAQCSALSSDDPPCAGGGDDWTLQARIDMEKGLVMKPFSLGVIRLTIFDITLTSGDMIRLKCNMYIRFKKPISLNLSRWPTILINSLWNQGATAYLIT